MVCWKEYRRNSSTFCNVDANRIESINTVLPTLFIVFNNIVRHCQNPFGINNIVQWPLTMWAVQHGLYLQAYNFFDRVCLDNKTNQYFLGYIGEFEIIDDHRAGKIVVNLNGRLNKVCINFVVIPVELTMPNIALCLYSVVSLVLVLTSMCETLKNGQQTCCHPDSLVRLFWQRLVALWIMKKLEGNTQEERFLAFSIDSLVPNVK
jgi:hypothetical protein